jgi:signal recognition particle subunit SRP54
MVLSALGNKLTAALARMSNSMIINEQVIDELLKDICNALMQADVSLTMVMKLRKNLKAKLKVEDMAKGVSRRRVISSVRFL